MRLRPFAFLVSTSPFHVLGLSCALSLSILGAGCGSSEPKAVEPEVMKLPPAEPPSATISTTETAMTPPVPESEPVKVHRLIACGKKSCNAGFELCLHDANGDACVPNSPKPAKDALYAECDDAGDCGSGMQCCKTPQGNGFVNQCSDQPCSYVALCKANDACPQGLRCQEMGGAPSTAEAASEMVCAEDEPKVRCSGKTCDGAKPLCLVKGKKGSCVAADAPRPKSSFVMRCSDAKDCSSGRVCCLLAGESSDTQCAGSCGAGMLKLCSNDGECEKADGGKGKCVPAIKHKNPHARELPAGAKLCEG